MYWEKNFWMLVRLKNVPTVVMTWLTSIYLLQGLYSSYMGQHQPQLYNVPGSVNTNAYSYGQLVHPGGSLAYRPIQGFLMPGPHPVQYGRPNVSGPMPETIPSIQAPFASGN